MGKPVISAFGTAYRVYWWMELYNSLSAMNDISFEIVFAGPNRPDFTLPDNFKFIQTNVKPVQCNEIAYRNTSGEYVLLMYDDLIYHNNFLDNLYNKLIEKSLDNYKKYIISPVQIGNNGILIPLKSYNFWPDIKKSPQLPLCCLIKKEKWEEAGGLDKNFIACFSDLDLYMRVISNGGKIIFCENAIFKERHRKIDKEEKDKLLVNHMYKDRPNKQSIRDNLCSMGYAAPDRKILEKFWAKTLKISKKESNKFSRKLKEVKKIYKNFNNLNELKKFNDIYNRKFSLFFKKYGIDNALNILFFDGRKGVIFKNRLFPVESFEDKDILKYSQGMRGDKWD